MFTKFMAVFGYIMLYMLIWAGLLLIPALNVGQTASSWPGITLAVMAPLIFILFVPFLNIVTKRTFHFAGEGQPTAVANLRHTLLTVNQFDVPVTAEQRRDNHIVFTWRYVDAKWWEIMSKAGLEKVYECHVKLDPASQTATLIDVTKSISWRAGVGGVKVGWFGFRGVDFSYEVGAAWGIQENFGVGEIYNYTFSPQEIKNPVMNSILRHGWDVRFGMW
jgi:hypothetical protein